VKIFVPGRVCLFGEHSDWAGGYRRIDASIEKGLTLITGTDQGIHAEVRPHPTSLVLAATHSDGTRIGPVELPMDASALRAEAERGGFWSYAAGVAWQVLVHHRVRGLSIDNFRTDLPMKKGLSSSAAISVLTARAFNRVYDLKLTVRGEMELAYQGEIATPSRCGRMDQGCAFGNRPVLMEFDGDRIDIREVRAGRDIFLVLVDLNGTKDTVEILRRLNRCYPFPTTDIDRQVHRYLGATNRRLVSEAVEAVTQGDAQRVGALMREAQRLFDEHVAPACSEQLTAPALHRLLDYAPLQPFVWGGKGVGSQGDGTAQLVARGGAERDRVIEIIERELGHRCLPLTLRAGRRVRRAVIPAAGFGTRLFPASKATKKELFPVVDRDGLAKPAILLIVEEALAAGIEEVALVVQRDDVPAFREFFGSQVSIENYDKLSAPLQEYARRLLEIGQRVRFVVQETQQGLGHAVLSAREFVGDEPFLLMLGDHLYRSTSSIPCARQLLDVFDEHDLSVVGVRRTPAAEIEHFGTVGGTWLDGSDRLLALWSFSEKPTLEYARENLRVPGLDADQYLTLFGQYVLKPQVFEFLAEHVAHNVRERGEIQLTSCLDRLRREDGFLGCLVDGQRFDIGMPEVYLRTLVEFRR
jgi:UTP-glucose-1-phosphate uridylyltransferase/mevalonate kinase